MRITSILQNPQKAPEWEHWKLSNGETQNNSRRQIQDSLSESAQLATYSSSSLQKIKGVFPGLSKAEGLWIGRH